MSSKRGAEERVDPTDFTLLCHGTPLPFFQGGGGGHQRKEQSGSIKTKEKPARQKYVVEKEKYNLLGSSKRLKHASQGYRSGQRHVYRNTIEHHTRHETYSIARNEQASMIGVW